MKGYFYCKKCGKKLLLLGEVEYSQLKEEGKLPDLCNPCIAKKIGLEDVFNDLIGWDSWSGFEL